MLESVPIKRFLLHAFRALKYTIFLSGSLHLTLVVLAALSKHKLDYLNPAHILGISILFPNLSNNLLVIVVGWLVLISIYIVILIALLQRKIIVAMLKIRREKITSQIKESYHNSRSYLKKTRQ